jgi:hypothetical protein
VVVVVVVATTTKPPNLGSNIGKHGGGEGPKKQEKSWNKLAKTKLQLLVRKE